MNNEAETRKVDDSVIELTIDSIPCVLMKVADHQNTPSNDYAGKKQFESASGGARTVLLHLIIPNGVKNLSPVYHVGTKEKSLVKPSMIFRMPTSPQRTWLLVDLDSLGSLSLLPSSSADFSLKEHQTALEALPLRWNPRIARTISYNGLPRYLYGKMP